MQERAKRTRWKSIFSGLDPALMISETASSHLSLVFSFRPSWSSSTPAYGTLLPWGRTMRRPLPVSPFFFSFIFSVLCRFRHTAKPALSLRIFLLLSLSLSRHIYLSFLFVLLKKKRKKDDIYPLAKGAGLIMLHTASDTACIL